MPVSLLLLDIDHFTALNDRFGHTAGDDALRQVAEVVGAVAGRPGDLAARWRARAARWTRRPHSHRANPIQTDTAPDWITTGALNLDRARWVIDAEVRLRETLGLR